MYTRETRRQAKVYASWTTRGYQPAMAGIGTALLIAVAMAGIGAVPLMAHCAKCACRGRHWFTVGVFVNYLQYVPWFQGTSCTSQNRTAINEHPIVNLCTLV